MNAPLQVSVSGADDALEQLFDLARRNGARHAGHLAVPTPSHKPLLAPVAAELSRALADVSLHPPAIPYISNVGGRALRDQDAIRDDLARSVQCPVRWHDATTLLYELGVRLFVEVPPGNVLTRLAADAFPDARCVSIDESGLDSALLLIRRTQNRTQ
jgi:malonate decarboxylase epsilon subunit